MRDYRGFHVSRAQGNRNGLSGRPPAQKWKEYGLFGGALPHQTTHNSPLSGGKSPGRDGPKPRQPKFGQPPIDDYRVRGGLHCQVPDALGYLSDWPLASSASPAWI